MADFILLMHEDGAPSEPAAWNLYFKRLHASGAFQGGSEIGPGQCFRKGAPAPPIAAHLGGYIKITARDLADAQQWLTGNPVYEAGGTVEIRELPKS